MWMPQTWYDWLLCLVFALGIVGMCLRPWRRRWFYKKNASPKENETPVQPLSPMEKTLHEALEGSRKIQIAFKEEKARDTRRLLQIIAHGMVSCEALAMANLWKVCHSGEWGNLDRTVVVLLTEEFNEREFIGQMQDVLEGIEVVQ